MPPLLRFLTLASYVGVGVRERSNRTGHMLHPPFSGAAIWYVPVPVYVHIFHSLLSPMGNHPSSIIALYLACCQYSLHLSRGSLCFGYANPNIIAYFLQPDMFPCAI